MEKFCRTQGQDYSRIESFVVPGIPYDEIIKKGEEIGADLRQIESLRQLAAGRFQDGARLQVQRQGGADAGVQTEFPLQALQIRAEAQGAYYYARA